MRLNLGCGSRKQDGWTNVDRFPGCNPDQVVDLEVLPWPWPDNSVREVQMIHVLEHLGQTPERFLGIIQELYRVCRHDARVYIVVPHPRHDSYLTDPTHVRPITADGMAMFSQSRNLRQQATGAANSPLGLMLGVDFETEKAEHHLDPRWQKRLASGQCSRAEIEEAVEDFNNVVESIHIHLKAVKR